MENKPPPPAAAADVDSAADGLTALKTDDVTVKSDDVAEVAATQSVASVEDQTAVEIQSS